MNTRSRQKDSCLAAFPGIILNTIASNQTGWWQIDIPAGHNQKKILFVPINFTGMTEHGGVDCSLLVHIKKRFISIVF